MPDPTSVLSAADLDLIRSIFREEIAELMAKDEDDLLTIEDVTNRLSISKTTLWQLRREGRITGHTVGRRVLFRESDVEALVNGGTS